MQGGVGDYTSRLALALRKLGLEVAVLTSAKAKPVPDSVDVFDQVEASVDTWSFSCWRRLTDFLSRYSPDVLHIQYQTAGYSMHPAINLAPLLLKLAGQRPRVLVTFHDLRVPYLFPKAGAIRRLPGYLLARCADGVVVTNSEDYSSLAKTTEHRGRPLRRRDDSLPSQADSVVNGQGCPSLWSGRPLFAIPIGSNILKSPPAGYEREAWRRRLGVEQGELLLVYFGFLNQNKGVDVLLHAFADLLKTGFGARLVMVGGSFGDSDPTNIAYGQRIRRQVESSEYSAKVIWTGFTSGEEVSANLLASDVCVLPFNEGASLRHGTLIAAIVHELPIITTTGPSQNVGHPAFPSLQRAVRLVPPRDAGALAGAILELGQSKSRREELSRSVAMLAPAFDWNVIGRAHVDAYDLVLSKRRLDHVS